jgi:mercuric ion binding protein
MRDSRKLICSAALLLAAHQSYAEQLRTVTLDVDNMTCAVCPITVKKALSEVPGVTSAKADLATHSAQVTYDAEKVKVETLVDAVTFAGYPARVKQP